MLRLNDVEGDPQITNRAVAAVLDKVGDRLTEQDANRFRAEAYHHAARTVRELDRPVAAILEGGGRRALEALPRIGVRLASAIDEIVHSGSLRLLERLEGQSAPEDLFATIPGIGEELAHRIHEHLHVDTLEALEAAAHDGRLERVPGFGRDRVDLIRTYLDGHLSRSSRRRARGRRAAGGDHPPRPGVAVLLAIDRRYRDLAAAGALPTIAPRRFNPDNQRWLPIWHPHVGGWHVTALFSNSARAHQLGKTHDWVVIYYERDGEEDQCTVVTEHRGPLAGERVVRGRENECLEHYRSPIGRAEISAWAHAQAERLS